MAGAKGLTEMEKQRIEARIAAAERLTSAELRVAVVRSSWLGIRRRARKVFEAHGLDRTEGRNAVLVVVDLRSREVVVYGDEGVDSRVGQAFWDEVRDAMIEEFRADRLAEGFAAGIRLLGERLAELFPARAEDVDELPNALISD